MAKCNTSLEPEMLSKSLRMFFGVEITNILQPSANINRFSVHNTHNKHANWPFLIQSHCHIHSATYVPLNVCPIDDTFFSPQKVQFMTRYRTHACSVARARTHGRTCTQYTFCLRAHTINAHRTDGIKQINHFTYSRGGWSEGSEGWEREA